jgi:hypothetical protein
VRTEHRLERGSMRSTPERPKTSSWSPWPTSWLVSRGLCCPAATSTDPQQRNGAEKVPSALEALRAPTFPHHHDGLNFPTEVCKGVARTKEQSQRRVCNLLLRMVLNDRRV